MEHLLILLAPLAVAALCGWIGYRCAHAELRYRRRLLDAEWQALERTRRIRAVFLNARRAMQSEARRTINQEGRKFYDER